MQIELLKSVVCRESGVSRVGNPGETVDCDLTTAEELLASGKGRLASVDKMEIEMLTRSIVNVLVTAASKLGEAEREAIRRLLWIAKRFNLIDESGAESAAEKRLKEKLNIVWIRTFRNLQIEKGVVIPCGESVRVPPSVAEDALNASFGELVDGRETEISLKQFVQLSGVSGEEINSARNILERLRLQLFLESSPLELKPAVQLKDSAKSPKPSFFEKLIS